MSFYPFHIRYMHLLSFPFGINWDVEGRTAENCPHICLHVCYTVWFSYSGSLIRTTRVLVHHLSFVAHVRQKHDISQERKSPKNWPLLSARGFHLEQEHLYHSYLFRFYLKFTKWPSWRVITKCGCMKLSSKELLQLLKSVMHHYRVMLGYFFCPHMMCWRNSLSFLFIYI